MKLGEIRLSHEVAKEECLSLSNGIVVRSVLELLEELKKMTDEIFGHHVSKYNNDFSEWILENYGDEKLAIKISKAGKKRKMERLLDKALKRELKNFLKGKKKDRVMELNKIDAPRRRRDVLRLLKGGH